MCYILILIVSSSFADESVFVFYPEQNRRNDPSRDDRYGVIGQDYNCLDDDEQNGPEFEWIEISNIGQRLDAEDDWNSGPISLGWSFNFYEEDFDSIRICSNGWASFTSDTTAYTPFQLPTEREPFNLLAVQWVDLNPDAGGSIYFWTDPDEEIAIVSWIGIPVWGSERSEQTFQMIIRGDDLIIFQYADGHPTGRLNCIGIQNSDGSDGLSIYYDRNDGGNAGRAYGIGNPWIEYPYEAGIFIDPDAIDFGIVLIDTFAVDTLTIINIGSEILVIDSIQTDDDVFTILDFENEEGIESGARWSFRARYEPVETGRVDDNIVIYSNAVNSDDGRTSIHITGTGRGRSVIEVEPREVIDTLYSTESSTHEITVRNVGGSELEYDTHLSSVTFPNQGVPWNSNIITRYALFQQTYPFGYDLENIFRSIEGLNYNVYRNAEDFDEVDLNDYDAVWLANDQPIEWIVRYNANRAKFEEFVDNGGIYYMCTASQNNEVAPIHPGGLVCRANQSENTGITQLSPESNFFIGYMEWNQGTRLRGEPFSLTDYTENRLRNIENCSAYNVLVIGEGQNIPIVVNYRYGSGNCIVSGTTDGAMHSNPNLYPWGRTGEAMLRNMDFLYNLNQWIGWSPQKTIVESEQDTTITITLEARNYISGDYSAEIHIVSNADNEPDIAINVDLHIIGVPDIEAIWSDELGYPDSVNWNSAYPDLINSENYELILILMNRGSAALQVDGISINDDVFSVDEGGFSLPPNQEREIPVSFLSDEPGEYTAIMTIESDDPDESEYEIRLYASSSPPPYFEANMESIEEELYAGGLKSSDLIINNSGGGQLRFRIDYNILQEPNIENYRRRYAVFQDREAWGWLRNYMLNPINGLDYDSYTRSADIGHVDLSQYRSIIVAGNQQSNAFYVACRNNQAWFEEYISNGGTMYIESGGAENFSFAAPGGVSWTYGRESYGRVVLNQEDNYLIELLGWEVDHRLSGLSFLYSYYPEAQFQELENSEWYDVIVEGYNTGNPGIVAYNYGRGAVMVAGCPIGYQWHWNDYEGEWGSTQDEILEYLSSLSNPSWMEFQPRTGIASSDEDFDVTVTLDSRNQRVGDYEAELIFSTNDPENPEVIIPVSMSIIGAPNVLVTWPLEAGYPHDFNWNRALGNLFVDTTYVINIQVSNNGTDTLYVEDITFDNDFFSLDFNSQEIAPNHFVQLDISLEVPEEEEGIQHAIMTILSNDPDNEELLIEMSAVAGLQVEREISFSAGWNLISLNVYPPKELYAEGEYLGPDIILMTDRLRIDENNHHILIFKDERGDYYNPAWDFNNIQFWNLQEGYNVKVDQDITATWSGIPIPAQSDIVMSEGWNIISYFPTYELDASAPDFYVLSPIIDHVVLAKNEEGSFIWPKYNYSDMEPWRQSQGYQVYVDEDLVFNYPEEAEEDAGVKVYRNPDTDLFHWAQPARTDRNMSVLIKDFNGTNIENGSQVVALNHISQPVGSGFVHNGMCGLSVWGDDPETENIDGLVGREVFGLKLWESGKEIETDLEVVSVEQGNGLKYVDNSFVVLDVKRRFDFPSEYYLGSNYPNPFNAVTRISYGLPEAAKVLIGIYDLSGRHVETLVDDYNNPGYHTVIWNSNGHASGMYLINMKTSKFSSIKTAVLIK